MTIEVDPDIEAVCDCIFCKKLRNNKIMANDKYQWCGPTDKDDKSFLGWVYARLQLYGDRSTDNHMVRLERLIDAMPGEIAVDPKDLVTSDDLKMIYRDRDGNAYKLMRMPS